jgi:CheY-like chemotaxis protein
VALLFTDVVMPGMNGRRLADEAVRQFPRLKVLFTTGYTRNAIVHNNMLDANVHLLAKPFTIEALGHKSCSRRTSETDNRAIANRPRRTCRVGRTLSYIDSTALTV